MANRAKDKGKRYERELVQVLRRQGFGAERVYGSGAIGTLLKGSTRQALDGDVYVPELDLTIEVKYRSAGMPCWLKELKGAIGLEDETGNRLIVLPEDNLRKLLTLEVETWTRAFETTWFLELMRSQRVLAIRLPRKGWILVRRL